MKMKFFFVNVVFLFLLGCLNTNKVSRLSIEDQKIMTDFIAGQKKKLPQFLDCCTTWVDVYQDKNQLVYLYKMNVESVDVDMIQEIKNKHYSKEKLDEICGMIIGVFESQVVFKYRIVNNKNIDLFQMIFTEELCK